MLSPREVVKEVAKRIADDQVCYIHRSTREITSFATEDKDTPQVIEEIKIIESKIDKYMKVVPMNTDALLTAMKYFLPEVTDRDVAKEIAKGFKRKNPTRNFQQIVDNHMDVKQHWRRFLKEHTHWYAEQIIIAEYNH